MKVVRIYVSLISSSLPPPHPPHPPRPPHCDDLRPVFPAGPQPRGRRYAKNARQNVRRDARKNIRRYARKNVRRCFVMKALALDKTVGLGAEGLALLAENTQRG